MFAFEMLIMAEKEVGEWKAAGDGQWEQPLAMEEPVRPWSAAWAGRTLPGYICPVPFYWLLMQLPSLTLPRFPRGVHMSLMEDREGA